MRRKLVDIVDILAQATSMIIRVALKDNKVENNKDNVDNNEIEYEPISEEESDNLINAYLETLENTKEFFSEWDKREDEDKYDEFLYCFYNLQNIIDKMEKHGMIRQGKDPDGTTTIEIPKLERSRNDN